MNHKKWLVMILVLMLNACKSISSHQSSSSTGDYAPTSVAPSVQLKPSPTVMKPSSDSLCEKWKRQSQLCWQYNQAHSKNIHDRMAACMKARGFSRAKGYYCGG